VVSHWRVGAGEGLFFDRINRIKRMKRMNSIKKNFISYPVNPVNPVKRKSLAPYKNISRDRARRWKHWRARSGRSACAMYHCPASTAGWPAPSSCPYCPPAGPQPFGYMRFQIAPPGEPHSSCPGPGPGNVILQSASMSP
jgi:hypothetical protein